MHLAHEICGRKFVIEKELKSPFELCINLPGISEQYGFRLRFCYYTILQDHYSAKIVYSSSHI